jgi:hypothetical protein
LTILLSLLGIPAFTRVLVGKFTHMLETPLPILVFLLGIVSFTLLWVFVLAKRGNFWSTLEHELTHALFALLFFKKINSISATRKKGGVIAIEGGNAVIALSPYFFPLAAVLMMIIKFVIPIQFEIYVIFLLGFTYQFHVINLFREFHTGQSDLHMAGFIFSVVLIIFMNIIFLGIILTSLYGSWNAALAYLGEGIDTGYVYVKMVAEYLFNYF